MPPWLCVALGSAAGGVARWLLAGALSRPGAAWPSGTLAVNVAGALLIGLLARRLLGPDAELARLLLATGFCGGFTTFSAFSLETLRFVQDGKTGRAMAYVAASVVLSLAATAAGWALGRRAG